MYFGLAKFVKLVLERKPLIKSKPFTYNMVTTLLLKSNKFIRKLKSPRLGSGNGTNISI